MISVAFFGEDVLSNETKTYEIVCYIAEYWKSAGPLFGHGVVMVIRAKVI